MRTRAVRPRWTWLFMRSTACWSWDARITSASPDPGRGRGYRAHACDPCTTAARDREPLGRRVEADETLVGGAEPGKPGRGAAGKTVVAGAIESGRGKGKGRRPGRRA